MNILRELCWTDSPEGKVILLRIEGELDEIHFRLRGEDLVVWGSTDFRLGHSHGVLVKQGEELMRMQIGKINQVSKVPWTGLDQAQRDETQRKFQERKPYAMDVRVQELLRYGQEFLAHLDQCRECEIKRNPFHLCPAGQRLIQLAGGSNPQDFPEKP